MRPRAVHRRLLRRFLFVGQLPQLALQAGAVGRVMQVIGVRGSLFVLPFISLTSYSSWRRPHPRRRRIVKILKQHRLFAPEHRQAGAVAAHLARGQVQGEGRGRHVLHAVRRRALGGCRCRGLGARRGRRASSIQRRALRRLDLGRLADQKRTQKARGVMRGAVGAYFTVSRMRVGAKPESVEKPQAALTRVVQPCAFPRNECGASPMFRSR